MPGQQFNRTDAGAAARTFFDRLWTDGDPWDLETSPFDQERYRRQLDLLADQRYGRVLEVGCAAGAFTEQLSTVADSVVVLDIAEAAVVAVRSRPSAASASFSPPYRDLAWNVGFLTERSETLLGTKNDVRFAICHDLFEKPAP